MKLLAKLKEEIEVALVMIGMAVSAVLYTHATFANKEDTEEKLDKQDKKVELYMSEITVVKDLLCAMRIEQANNDEEKKKAIQACKLKQN